MIPKEFMTLFDSLSRSHGSAEVFRDFLDVFLFVLSCGKYREDYARIDRLYDEQENRMFMRMVQVVADHSEGFRDIIGEVFMEHISHGHNGQFFTPQHVSDLMAAVTCANIRLGQSVYDPTCGSGRMLLSAVKSLSRTNPNDRIFCYGSDIDLTCVKMTAINMLMNSVPGEIAWMNTLTLEHWRSYQLNLVRVANVWLPTFTVLEAGHTNLILRVQESLKNRKAMSAGELQLSFDF